MAQQHMPRSFRFICKPEEIPLVEELLRAEGYDFEPEPFSQWCRKLTHEPAPLGSSLAAFFGRIYIQDRSSMLPPLALCPPSGAAVLDMCASPGSKTGFLAQLTGREGFVLGNEPSKSRLATLRQNLFTLNMLHTATCSYPGEALPLPSGSWQYVQLDPPCSGWGTVERNPNVLNLWTAEKLQPLIAIQKALLKEAARLLAPGGRVVFSTCTTNVQENEEQVIWAQEQLGLELEPLEPFSGFVFEAPYIPGCEGTLRVDPEASQAQGFYIASFRKPSGSITEQEQAGCDVRLLADAEFTEHSVDESLLPDGEMADVKGNALFLPRYALETFPKRMRWRGTTIGKMQRGEIRPSPRMHSLMVPFSPELGISLDDPAPIRRLLTGQSLPVETHAKDLSLYFKTLPLGRLRVKGKRVLWSEK